MSKKVEVEVREKKDVEELREVFSAINVFLKELSPTLKELLETIMGVMDGARLGREVGEFYRSLVEAGVDKEQASKLTEEFLRNRMAVTRLVSEFVKPRLAREVEVETRCEEEREEEES